MNTELNEDWSTVSPSGVLALSVLIFSIIAFATCSLALDQISITLLYLSPLVTRPESNCFSIALTSFSEVSIIFAFSSGITKSLTPMEEPERVEKSKPKYINWSAKITVFLSPAFLYEISTNFDTDFLFKTLFILLKPTSTGVILHISILPTVVSSREVSPLACSTLTLIGECISKFSVSYARSTSSGLLKTLPPPDELALSLVI